MVGAAAAGNTGVAARRNGARVPVRIGLLAGDGGTAAGLQAVLAAGARIDRIASPALLAAPVAARLRPGPQRWPAGHRRPAGIRQTLVTDGVARFTRLAQLFEAGQTSERSSPSAAGHSNTC